MEEPVVVRTFVTEATLGEGVLRAVLVLILLGLILIGAAVALADRLGRTLVRPVADLADAARQMAGGDLGARVRPGGPPELADVGAAFNQMAERVTDLIEEERESLADLSHALRTPLTSLRLQVEAIDDTEAAGSMAQDLDRLSARVDGLISEARRLSPSAGRRETDLCAVVRDRFTFWGVLAEEQGREHHVTVPPGSLPVALTEDEAAVMIDTLLENVFTHTAPGTGYRVTIQGAGGGALLAVEDEGDGFPSRDVVARGTSGAGSTGLGLDIVRRAAERSGGGITLTSGPGGGARIEVVLGGPRLPAPR